MIHVVCGVFRVFAVGTLNDEELRKVAGTRSPLGYTKMVPLLHAVRSLGRGLSELRLGAIDGGGGDSIVPRVYNDNETQTAPTSVC